MTHPARPLRVGILHYRDDFRHGGTLRVGETIANHLDPTRAQAHLVFAYGGPGSVSARSRVPCHFLEARWALDPRGWARLRRLVRSLGLDVVHDVDGALWPVLALLGTRPTRILHVHDRYIPSHTDRASRLIHRAMAGLVPRRIFISQAARQSHLEARLARPRSSKVVRNAISPEDFSRLPERFQARRSLGIPEDAKILGMVSRLTAAKGCLDAVRVLERLSSRWHLVLTNDGPLRESILARTRERGLAGRVHLLGVQPDVRSVYAALDALGFFTYYEAFGLVLAEAMASGIPIFGLGADGEYREPDWPLLTPENSVLVERARPTGYFAEEDPSVLDALAARIEDYGERPERYRSMIATAQAWVRERFSAERQAGETLLAYRELVGPARSDVLTSSP